MSQPCTYFPLFAFLIEEERESLADEHSLNRPVSFWVNSNMVKTHESVTHGRRITNRLLFMELGIRKEMVRAVLEKDLRGKKNTDLGIMRCLFPPPLPHATRQERKFSAEPLVSAAWAWQWSSLYCWILLHGHCNALPHFAAFFSLFLFFYLERE